MAPRDEDGKRSLHHEEGLDEWCNESMPERPTPHVPTNEEVQDHVDAVHGSDSWEAKVLHILHSRTVECILAGLLMLDVVILFVELFLGAQYPSCSVVTRDAISCCPAVAVDSAYDGDDDHYRFLAEETDEPNDLLACGVVGSGGHRFLAQTADADANKDEHHSVCHAGMESACPAACDEHKYAGIHAAHTILFSMTIVILGIFLIELCLLIVCLKPRVFFKKSFYVLDFVVVTMSLGLELGFYFSSSQALAEIAGLLIFARLWRFVRIGHGIIEVTNEYHGHKHAKVMKYNKQLEDLLMKNGIELPEDEQKGMEKLKRLDSVQTIPNDAEDTNRL